MAGLPTGTVTFLFTDIEGSTTLLQRLGDRSYAKVLEEHRRLFRVAFAEGNGQEVDTQGDAFLVAFPRAGDALATAVDAQRALTKHTWPDGASLRVRMGLHTGEPVSQGGDYAGLDVHRASRICSVGHQCRLSVCQMPVADEECDYESDQKKIEKKSSKNDERQTAKIFHWFLVSDCRRSSSSSMTAS
jgi:class 3 adenylate cyclase